MTQFGYVPPPFHGLWPDIIRLLDRAVAKGGNRWGDVKAALATGHAQLWLTDENGPINASVTRMDGDTLEIWLCGGDVLRGSLGHLETALQAARRAGAVRARIIGRKGWARVLGPYGWQQQGDELVRTLR